MNEPVLCLLNLKLIRFKQIAFGLINIYASTDPRIREQTWLNVNTWILSQTCDTWILAGDFNNTPNWDLKIGKALNMSVTERQNWDNLIDTNLFHHIPSSSAKYTWSNKQDGNKRVFCTLDRFYVNN